MGFPCLFDSKIRCGQLSPLQASLGCAKKHLGGGFGSEGPSLLRYHKSGHLPGAHPQGDAFQTELHLKEAWCQEKAFHGVTPTN